MLHESFMIGVYIGNRAGDVINVKVSAIILIWINHSWFDHLFITMELFKIIPILSLFLIYLGQSRIYWL